MSESDYRRRRFAAVVTLVAFVLLYVRAASAQTDLTSGLISRWSLDETSGTRADSVSSIGVSQTGGNPGSAAGVFGNSVTMNAANNGPALATGSNASLQMGDEDFTLAGWVYLGDYGTYVIASKYNYDGGSAEYQISYRTSINRLYFRVSPDGGTVADYGVASSSQPASGQWVHVAAWHDSANDLIGIAVNGVTSTAVYTRGVYAGSASFIFGANNENSGTSFNLNGRLDEWALWGRVLTADEISRLYNAGAGCEYPYTACTATATPTPTATFTAAPTSTDTPPPASTSTPTPTATSVPPTSTSTPGLAAPPVVGGGDLVAYLYAWSLTLVPYLTLSAAFILAVRVLRYWRIFGIVFAIGALSFSPADRVHAQTGTLRATYTLWSGDGTYISQGTRSTSSGYDDTYSAEGADTVSTYCTDQVSVLVPLADGDDNFTFRVLWNNGGDGSLVGAGWQIWRYGSSYGAYNDITGGGSEDQWTERAYSFGSPISGTGYELFITFANTSGNTDCAGAGYHFIDYVRVFGSYATPTSTPTPAPTSTPTGTPYPTSIAGPTTNPCSTSAAIARFAYANYYRGADRSITWSWSVPSDQPSSGMLFVEAFGAQDNWTPAVGSGAYPDSPVTYLWPLGNETPPNFGPGTVRRYVFYQLTADTNRRIWIAFTTPAGLQTYSYRVNVSYIGANSCLRTRTPAPTRPIPTLAATLAPIYTPGAGQLLVTPMATLCPIEFNALDLDGGTPAPGDTYRVCLAPSRISTLQVGSYDLLPMWEYLSFFIAFGAAVVAVRTIRGN